MGASGKLQLLLWNLKLELRKSELLRQAVRLARRLRPDTRERHLRNEVGYWRRWAATGGLQWPEDFAARFDPAMPLQGHMAAIVDSLPGDEIHILDVGAGPATVLGKVHPTKRITITPTDPLGHEYNKVLDDFGLKPPVRTQYAEAEKLRAEIGDRQFDIVHAQNSLDHSADPIAGIEEMLALTRPGGAVVLLHEEDEGEKELYYALHKWNFRCREGEFIVAGPGPDGPPRNVTELLKGRAEVECRFLGDEILTLIRKNL